MFVPQPKLIYKQFQKVICEILILLVVLIPLVSAQAPPPIEKHVIKGKITYSDDIPPVNVTITITNVKTEKTTNNNFYRNDTGIWKADLSKSDYPDGTRISVVAEDGKGNRANMTAIIDISGGPLQDIGTMKFEVPAPAPPTPTPTDSGDGDGSDGYVPATLTPMATPGVTPISSPTAALTQTTEPTPTPVSTITATETPTEPTPASSTPTTMLKRGIWFRFSKPGFDTPFFIVIAIAAILAAAILLVAVYFRRKREGGE